ncbi:MAG: 2-keto-4-pentenoate hydratase [Sphingomonas sp.]
MASDDYSENGVRRIAEAFVAARRAGRALPDYPGRLPADLDQGYAVQDAAIALMAQRVGGWKVGRINPPIDGTARLVGPIFADRIVAPAAHGIEMTIFSDGFGAAEAEFLLRIGSPPPAGKTSFTRDEAKALIDAVHVGIEVASSPFPGINSHGAPVTVSDFGNNNGLVIGAAIADWRDDGFESWPVELRINGEVAGRGQAVDMLDGAIGAARFLFGALAERGIALEPGQWISSGAVTGVHPVKPGDAIEARFDDRMAVTCTIAAA